MLQSLCVKLVVLSTLIACSRKQFDLIRNVRPCIYKIEYIVYWDVHMLSILTFCLCCS